MKKNLLKLTFIFSLILILPIVTFAQITIISPETQACTGNGLGLLLCNIHQLLNAVVPVLIALGVLYFVWGVVQYVIAGGEEAKKQGKDRVIYGIIGLVVIIGVWGLVGIVVETFNIGEGVAPVLQAIGGSEGSCELGNNPKLSNLLDSATCIINNSLIPLMFALAVVYFVWGVIQFVILGAGEETKRTQGKQCMIWGIIALAVMLSIWGLVAILGSTFGVETNFLPQVSP